MDRCLATPLFAAGDYSLRVAGQPVDSADSPSSVDSIVFCRGVRRERSLSDGDDV